MSKYDWIGGALIFIAIYSGVCSHHLRHIRRMMQQDREVVPPPPPPT